MPSVAELVPHSDLQESVGNDEVYGSIVHVSSLKLTAELRSLIVFVARMTTRLWTAIIPSSSFPD